jgi:hypothetical protein
MFVGYGLNKAMVEGSVKQFRVILENQDYKFNPADSDPQFLSVSYDDRKFNDGGTGLVTIRVSLSLTATSKAAYEMEFANDKPKFCQPATYCAPSGSQCQCAPNTDCTDSSVCSWAIKDIDCPLEGCFAFGITMPSLFKTGIATKPPVPAKYSDDKDYNWSIPFDFVDSGVSGAQCHYTQ